MQSLLHTCDTFNDNYQCHFLLVYVFPTTSKQVKSESKKSSEKELLMYRYQKSFDKVSKYLL